MVSNEESPRKISGWKLGCREKKSERTGFKEEESQWICLRQGNWISFPQELPDG